MMHVQEYWLSPGFQQSLSIKTNAEFLKLLALPNNYGSVDVILYMLENENGDSYETITIQSVPSMTTFSPNTVIQYLDSILVDKSSNHVLHFFLEKP